LNPKNKEINVLTNVEEESSALTQNIVVETIQPVVSELSDKFKKTKKTK